MEEDNIIKMSKAGYLYMFVTSWCSRGTFVGFGGVTWSSRACEKDPV